MNHLKDKKRQANRPYYREENDFFCELYLENVWISLLKYKYMEILHRESCIFEIAGLELTKQYKIDLSQSNIGRLFS